MRDVFETTQTKTKVTAFVCPLFLAHPSPLTDHQEGINTALVLIDIVCRVISFHYRQWKESRSLVNGTTEGFLYVNHDFGYSGIFRYKGEARAQELKIQWEKQHKHH